MPNRHADTCLRRMVRADWNCMDVGAHVGSVSYLLSTLAPRGRLTIIEALPRQGRGPSAPPLPKVPVHQVAVGEAGAT